MTRESALPAQCGPICARPAGGRHRVSTSPQLSLLTNSCCRLQTAVQIKGKADRLRPGATGSNSSGLAVLINRCGRMSQIILVIWVYLARTAGRAYFASVLSLPASNQPFIDLLSGQARYHLLMLESRRTAGNFAGTQLVASLLSRTRARFWDTEKIAPRGDVLPLALHCTGPTDYGVVQPSLLKAADKRVFKAAA